MCNVYELPPCAIRGIILQFGKKKGRRWFWFTFLDEPLSLCMTALWFFKNIKWEPLHLIVFQLLHRQEQWFQSYRLCRFHFTDWKAKVSSNYGRISFIPYACSCLIWAVCSLSTFLYKFQWVEVLFLCRSLSLFCLHLITVSETTLPQVLHGYGWFRYMLAVWRIGCYFLKKIYPSVSAETEFEELIRLIY